MNFHLQFNSLFPHAQFHVDRCPLSECIRENVFACPKNGILILIVYSDHHPFCLPVFIQLALSGVESRARCTCYNCGPHPVMINQRLR